MKKIETSAPARDKKQPKLQAMLRIEHADKYIFVHKYQEARLILEDILKKQDDLLVHLRYVELLVRIDEIDTAKKYYRQHQSRMISDTGIVMLEQYLGTQSPSVSNACYSKLIDEYGDYACAYFGMGLNYERLQDYEQAITHYQKSLQLDEHWYPAYFGLSQAYYQSNSPDEGSHYFSAFERIAPFSIYGNFSTHKRLSQEYFLQGKYDEAKKAFDCLVEWFENTEDNCPPEIRFYNYLNRVKITQATGDIKKLDAQQIEASAYLTSILKESVSSDVLLFIVNSCQELDFDSFVFSLHQQIISHYPQGKILGNICYSYYRREDEDRLIELLVEETAKNYESKELRRWLVITRLKKQKLDINSYLTDKERMESLLAREEEKLDLLELLHNLVERFPYDADIYRQLGVFYRDMEAEDKAQLYFKKMHALDPKYSANIFAYVEFFLLQNNHKRAKGLLDELAFARLSRDKQAKYKCLQTKVYIQQGRYDLATEAIRCATKITPWSVIYLVYEAYCLTNLYYQQKKIPVISEDIISLYRKQEMLYSDFKEENSRLRENKLHYLAYVRSKISFLYGEAGNVDDSLQMLRIACAYNPEAAICEFMKLLNTNYDSAYIHYSLGIFHKEYWRHETACGWFDSALEMSGLSAKLKQQIHIELADSYVWLGHNLKLAMEYAHRTMKASYRHAERARLILTHAYLKEQNISLAAECLGSLAKDSAGYEYLYLKGMLAFHSKDYEEAYKVWQIIVGKDSDGMRFHHIKQELTKYFTNSKQYKEVG